MDTNASANRVEVAIQVGLALLLIAACFLILRTFLPLFAWGVILAIALYPVYGKLQSLLGGRRVLSAIVLTLLLLALLIVPIVLLGRALIQGSEAFAIRLRDGTLTIPPPPVRVETWPVIGMPF